MGGKLTVLAIGAHVGDVELASGGVLASHSLKGDRIVTLALTPGERGVPAGQEMNEYRKQKVKEAESFAAMLGGEAVVFDYCDGELPDHQQIRMEVCDVIRRVKPDIIITHWKNSMHKDHALTHHIVGDARFFASLSSLSVSFLPTLQPSCTIRKTGKMPWTLSLTYMWILIRRPMTYGLRL